jgi:hypothetical protein
VSDSDIQKAGDHSDEELNPDVFVFASNPHGHHLDGSAKEAYEEHGATWGIGEGRTGDAYALPITDDVDASRAAVGRFLAFAAEYPWTKFVVSFELTPAMDGWFDDVPENVVLRAVEQ